jgi:glycosyltransferase involved in cell wall biosynthesis
MSSSTRISLVLATIHRTTELERCLQSLAAQNYHDYDVILVDQNDDDRLVPIVCRMKAQGLALNHVRLFVKGLAGARNHGLQFVSGDVIGFPDDDCWYEPDTLEKLAASFQGAVDGVIAYWIEFHANQHPQQKHDGRLSLEAWRQFRGGNASSITIFLKKTLLEQLNGFDQRLGVGQWFGSAEETDLILRSLTLGATIIKNRNIHVHHHHGIQDSRPDTTVINRVRARERGTGALYAKHRLGLLTILRGLTAPIVRAACTGHGKAGLKYSINMVHGRVEGMLKWGWGRQ